MITFIQRIADVLLKFIGASFLLVGLTGVITQTFLPDFRESNKVQDILTLIAQGCFLAVTGIGLIAQKRWAVVITMLLAGYFTLILGTTPAFYGGIPKISYFLRFAFILFLSVMGIMLLKLFKFKQK